MRHIDLQDPAVTIDVFREGADANRSARCRVGSIDRIGPPGTLIATGDLHDNPLHLQRLVDIAGFEGHARDDAEAAELDAFPDPKHLVLHEVIHSDNLMNGMDFSYRALARVAALKADHPEHVHTMLANHELSQVIGAGIVKGGIRVVEAFNAGLEYAFGDDTPAVADAIAEFVRSMPLALRCVSRNGDILCAHSLPGVGAMHKFDATVIERDLIDDDYVPRKGSAHLMVWGRGYDGDQLEDLVERWGINMFILGHEHVPGGAMLFKPNA
ncbi:MAG: metallophosphoesterase, partial [Phycisphaerales bacterium]|nr:metallophosphoesterase [Phycisphaerales bacterium]